ncbi:MAG: M15 family metallopeptidase [Oscillospiraceae bacterium]|nr:M15 family metallopeptidase [Oscillospiraceae bacterium]
MRIRIRIIFVIFAVLFETFFFSACQQTVKQSLNDCLAFDKTISPLDDLSFIQPDTNTSTLSTYESDIAVEKEYIDYLYSGGEFELPINGASGYASVSLNIYEDTSIDSAVLGSLISGQAFEILNEFGEWWQINTDTVTGWVMRKYCFINLPDIIPSIIYNIDNASASEMKSSGKDIPNITGKKLYDAYSYNQRLGREEYIVPVLYPMALKICAAQQAALAEGNTIIIYEGFRPYDVQQLVVSGLNQLAAADADVNAGINTPPWSMGWFMARGVSNHQKGYAIDAGLGKVINKVTAITGDYIYSHIESYQEYEMPTNIHELSSASVIFENPIISSSDTEWRKAILSDKINEPALLLQKYCTEAGMTPLASEWWHFNDLESAEITKQSLNTGNYYLYDVKSQIPVS